MNDRINSKDFFDLEKKLLEIDSDDFDEISNLFSSLTSNNLYESSDLPSFDFSLGTDVSDQNNSDLFDFNYPSELEKNSIQGFGLENNSTSDSLFFTNNIQNSEKVHDNKEVKVKENENENQREREQTINKITKQQNSDYNLNYKDIEYDLKTKLQLEKKENEQQLLLDDFISEMENKQIYQKTNPTKYINSIPNSNTKATSKTIANTNTNIKRNQKKTKYQKPNLEISIQKTKKQAGKYGKKLLLPWRKRELFGNNDNKNLNEREKSTVVESGKQIFKLVVGQMWVISGGSTFNKLAPYTNQLVTKISQVLKANEKETKNFQNNLKYLLTNSRRTFTEYILEILIGILSLIHSNDKIEEQEQEQNQNQKPKRGMEYLDLLKKNKSNNVPKISKKFLKILVQIAEYQIKKSNEDLTKNEIEKINQKENKLKQRLHKIYQQIFTEEVLLYWFDKRFVDRLEHIFEHDIRTKFYKDHLLDFGRSKFMLSCLILARELVSNLEVSKKYFQLIDLDYKNDPLNLYSNNRGKKQKVVKDLIVRFSLNGGEYWNVLSNDYMKQLKFNTQNITEHFPFKPIIFHPLLVGLLANDCQKGQTNLLSQKKRVLACKSQKIDPILNFSWCFKKAVL
ncbi:atp-dependent helicase brm [Anaeramoeba flamelloides]|uniref:Atp-dependent helicase brm n=1 Tax=Anaeramoeba flamelloides TaxID=1746091 RepID=A0ABQ8XTC3_9EUKA|nr:atp-dependent helicase brm [Anaeramoeba flamelloides]